MGYTTLHSKSPSPPHGIEDGKTMVLVYRRDLSGAVWLGRKGFHRS